MNNRNLDNKVAIVTGANQGMGRAIAQRLKQEGARVIVFDIVDDNKDFEFYKVDIRDSKGIKEALSHIDKVDIVVNNAGIYFEKYVEETTDEEIDKMVDINIKGTYLMIRNTLSKIKKSKGTIVNIASCLGLVPELTSPLYCTTKAGIIMLTKCLAQEYAEIGVRINCVLPGPINTPLLQKSFKTKEQEEKCASRIPIRRIGEAEDIANMVNFLISDEAKYITGGVYAVDGGVSSSSLYSK